MGHHAHSCSCLCTHKPRENEMSVLHAHCQTVAKISKKCLWPWGKHSPKNGFFWLFYPPILFGVVPLFARNCWYNIWRIPRLNSPFLPSVGFYDFSRNMAKKEEENVSRVRLGKWAVRWKWASTRSPAQKRKRKMMGSAQICDSQVERGKGGGWRK